MFSATSCALVSALRTSWMFKNTSLSVSACTSFLSCSTPAPRLPMTMPGLAVWMLIFALLAARSTSTSATPAWSSLVLMNRLRRMSSCSHFAYCFCSYHLEFQLLMMPSRNPTGCVFCPMLYSASATVTVM